MPKTLEAQLNGKGLRVAIVASRFNGPIVSKLIDGAVDCLVRHGVANEAITLVRVPGSFELPQAAGPLAGSGKYDVVIPLGVLIRGETAHFDLIAREVTRGLGELGASGKTVVPFGLLTAESTEQAEERAGGKHGNRGWDAALAALEMAGLRRELG